MEATARAVEKLTEEHSEVIDGAIGTSGPLLELLREARYPNLGRTKGGGGSGDMLDVAAIAMYENIDGVVRAWLQHFREHHTGDLIPLVKRLHTVLVTEDAGDRLEDRDRMFGMFGHWVDQIENHFDPPHEYELTAACPECGAERIAGNEESLKWAVRIPVRIGHALVAECHACGRMWAGRDDLTELAEQIGDVVDWVALRELSGDTAMRTTPV